MLWRGVGAAAVRDLRAAGMTICKVEPSLRPNGTASDRFFDVSFEGDIASFHDLRLMVDTARISLVAPVPRPARPVSSTVPARPARPRRAPRARVWNAAERAERLGESGSAQRRKQGARLYEARSVRLASATLEQRRA